MPKYRVGDRVSVKDPSGVTWHGRVEVIIPSIGYMNISDGQGGGEAVPMDDPNVTPLARSRPSSTGRNPLQASTFFEVHEATGWEASSGSSVIARTTDPIEADNLVQQDPQRRWRTTEEVR